MTEYTDRYDALGLPPPDPATMCPDECEGTGFVPVKGDRIAEPWATLWRAAEAKEPADDGWHFVRCPTCNGTGRKTD
jgi:hypothetical protein